MKIKLKALRLPSQSGKLKKPVDNTSSSDFDSLIDINRLYLRDTSGELKGVQLGIDKEIWIAYSEIDGDNTIERNDQIILNDTDIYEISDLMKKEDSQFENHYKLNVKFMNKTSS